MVVIENLKSKILKTAFGPWPSALALFVLVFGLYLRTGGWTYLRLDDWGYTAGCGFVASGLSSANIAEAFSRVTYGGIWMPLTFITYMADVTLFGGGWGVHHLVNAFLHALNASILFLILVRLAGRDVRGVAIAALSALLWALHPQRVEAVAWIASRKEELWTLFTLLGLAGWSRGRWFAGYVCCALACLSKPTAVCFPILAFLVERWVDRTAPRPSNLIKYIPLLLMALITGLAAMAAQSHPEGMTEISLVETPIPVRIVKAFSSLAVSLGSFALPYPVYFDYLSSSPNAWNIAGIVFFLVIMALAFMRTRRNTLFTLLVFLVAYFPVSGILGGFGEHARADRFLYLPSMAFSLLIVLAVPKERLLPVALAVLCCASACLSWPVIGSYRNNLSVFERTIAFEPDNWRALRHLGSEYCARLGKMDEGISMLEKSWSISPRPETLEVLVYSLACRMSPDDPRKIARLASTYAHNPSLDRRGMILEALGAAAAQKGEYEAAAILLKLSISAPERFYPDTEARFRLIDALKNSGDTSSALSILRPLTVSADPEIRKRALAMAVAF